MKKMNVPNIDYSIIFDACIGSMRTGVLKTALLGKKSFFVMANDKYIELSNPYSLHLFLNYDSQVIDETVTHKELVNLYSKLRDNSGAIKFHNEIKNSTDVCLYCSGNSVACLDHYLPKDDFSLLSIAPANLIPSCNDCNFKLNDLYSQNPPPAIHPYFEHYPGIFNTQWIYARVPLEQPFFVDNNFEAIAIEFYVDFEGVELEETIKNRVIFQFENFIVKSYVSRCVEILTKELNRLRRYLGTANQLKTVNKAYLLDTMIDHSSNTYHYATYYALANSNEYLEKVENDFF